ncbi:precorrin-3B C(17)-methyltransferase [Halorutilales archaeon Cl-col2-1]
MSEGTLYIVGIGPGVPDKMTQEARDVIRDSEVVVASSLYQKFLRLDDVIGNKITDDEMIEELADEDPFPIDEDTGEEGRLEVTTTPGGALYVEGATLSEAEEKVEDEGIDAFITTLDSGYADYIDTGDEGDGQLLVKSSMGRQVELAYEAIARVREGQDVAHVSGGDPNTYGKSDLVFKVLEHADTTDVNVEIVEGVTAGMSVSADLGAPLSGDFATVSLSDKWRDWDVIEDRLRNAARSDFVILLYNCWTGYDEAADVLQEELDDEVPVGIVHDAGREEHGRNDDGEVYRVTNVGEMKEYSDEISGMGVSVLVGNSKTEVWEADDRDYLVTPRGGRDIEDF